MNITFRVSSCPYRSPRVRQDMETENRRNTVQQEMDMKYVVIIAVVVLTFAAGVQVSSANSNIVLALQAEKDFSINDYASELLMPDGAVRMLNK